MDEGRGPRREAVAPGLLCPCVAEWPVLAPLRCGVATDMKNTVLKVIFDLNDGRRAGGRYLARQCMQVARGRDFVRPGLRLGLVHAGRPRRWSRLMETSRKEASWSCSMSCSTKQAVG